MIDNELICKECGINFRGTAYLFNFGAEGHTLCHDCRQKYWKCSY